MAMAATRVLQIMEYIASQYRGPTHKQIAEHLDIPKSSLTALLSDLRESGYISVDTDSGRYSIGSEILALSYAYLRNLDVVRIGQKVVSDVFLATNEFTALSIRRGIEYVIVSADVAPTVLGHSRQIGESGPLLGSAAGKILLAFLDDEERDAVLAQCPINKFTQYSITDPKKIRAELVAVRKEGFSYGRGEVYEGMTAIGAPVFNALGKIVAAMTVTTATSRLTNARTKEIQAQLRRGAEAISEQLGYRANDPPFMHRAVEAGRKR
jgi:DNA-binding IclR family transcriptional regulator